MRVLLTFILLCVVSIVEASPTPGWVLGRGHMEYDPTQYLTGVGFSKENSISASESARSELIKSIRVQINAVSKDYNSTGKSFAESSVHTSTDFLLEGSQVKDGWYDEEKEIYYSLVVIKRQYVLDTLLNIIDLNFEKNLLNLKQGDDFFTNGDVLKALVYYYEGYVDSLKLFPYIQTYNSVILSNNEKLLDKKYVLNLIFKDKISKITDNINIKSSAESINDGVVKFGVRVFLNDKPVSDFPIKFYSVYKHFVERVSCKIDGCSIETNVSDVIRNNNKLHLVAVVDFKTLPKYFSYQLEDTFFKRMRVLSVVYKVQLQELVADNPFVNGGRIETVESQRRKHKAFKQLEDEVLYRGRGRRYGNDVGGYRGHRSSSSGIDWNIGLRSPNVDIRIGNN